MPLLPSHDALDDRYQVGRDAVNRLFAVDFGQQPFSPIPLDERRRLFKVDVDTMLLGFGRVVGPLVQLAAALIAARQLLPAG